MRREEWCSSLWTKDWGHESRKLFFPKVMVPYDPQIVSNLLQFLFYWTHLLSWVPLIYLLLSGNFCHLAFMQPLLGSPCTLCCPSSISIAVCCLSPCLSRAGVPRRLPSSLNILLEWSYLGGVSQKQRLFGSIPRRGEHRGKWKWEEEKEAMLGAMISSQVPWGCSGGIVGQTQHFPIKSKRPKLHHLLKRYTFSGPSGSTIHGQNRSGSLKATSDRESQRTHQELMCTKVIKVLWDMSGAWALLATPTVYAGGFQVARSAQPSPASS